MFFLKKKSKINENTKITTINYTKIKRHCQNDISFPLSNSGILDAIVCRQKYKSASTQVLPISETPLGRLQKYYVGESFLQRTKGTTSGSPYLRHNLCRRVADVGNGLSLMSPSCVEIRLSRCDVRESFSQRSGRDVKESPYPVVGYKSGYIFLLFFIKFLFFFIYFLLS